MKKWLLVLLFLSNCGVEKTECLFNLYQDGHNNNCGGIKLLKVENKNNNTSVNNTPAAAKQESVN